VGWHLTPADWWRTGTVLPPTPATKLVKPIIDQALFFVL